VSFFKAIFAGLLLLVFGACSEQKDVFPDSLVVFAASSLTNVFIEMAESFEQANPGVEVEMVFAASSTLRLQLEQGAKADVFASANERQLQLAQEAGLLESAPLAFASTGLTIAARVGGPVTSFEDIASTGVRLALAGEEVPAGAYAAQLLDQLAHDPAFGPGWVEQAMSNVVSREPNVRQVLAKVQIGAVDAAIAYSTDLAAGPTDQVAEVAVPTEHTVRASYWIGLTKDGGQSVQAAAFVHFVRSEEGQALLAQYGFGESQ
jgi:molybdate transport system substrate-binding protein